MSLESSTVPQMNTRMGEKKGPLLDLGREQRQGIVKRKRGGLIRFCSSLLFSLSVLPPSYLCLHSSSSVSSLTAVIYPVCILRGQTTCIEGIMEYLSPTTVTFVAAGAGAGAYYVYANVIEPQNQAQRILQAEQAQQELLRLEEAKLSKRGSNKQAKKKVVVVRPKKGDGSPDKDDFDLTAKEVDERIAISNPFDILEGNNMKSTGVTLAQNSKKDPKRAGSKKGSLSVSTSDVSVLVATTKVVGTSPLDSPLSPPVKSEKTVKFDSGPSVQSEIKVEVDTTTQGKSVSKRERKASKKAASAMSPVSPVGSTPVSISTTAAAVTTQTPRTGKISVKQVISSPREAVEDREPSSFSPMHTPAMQSRNQPVVTPKDSSHPPLHSSEEDDFQVVKSQSRSFKQFAQASASFTEPSVTEAVSPEKSPRKTTVPKNGAKATEAQQEEVKVTSDPEAATCPSAQEWEALQALVKAKELSLVALEARQSQYVRKIQELEKQMDADADVVRSAKRTETRAQRFDEKVRSLNYTNTALVSQLSVEKENTKDALLKLKKAQREHEKALQGAVAASMAEHVCAANEGEDHSAELSSMETRIQELEHHRDHLITQNNDLQHQLQQLLSQSDALMRQENTFREREEERTRFIAQVQFQLHEAQASLSKKEVRIELLEAEMGALEGELESAKLEAEQYATRVGHAEEAVRSLSESYEGEKHSLMEELEMVRATAAQEAAHAANKELSANADLQGELERVRAELVSVKEEHEVLSFKHEEQVAAMSAAAAAAAAELSHQNGTGRVELAVKTLELQKVQDELTSTISDLKAARTDVQTLADQLAEAQAVHVQQMGARQAELEHLAKELKESNDQITTMSEQQTETKAQVAELQARTSEFSDMAQAQSERLLGRLEEMEKTLAATIEREESLGAEKEALSLQLTDLSSKHEQCETLCSKLAQEQTELSTKFSTSTLEHSLLLKEKGQLEAEATERKETIDRLEKARFSLATEHETLSLKLGVAIEAERVAQEKLAELGELKEEYAAMAAHILELEAKLSVHQKQEEPVVVREAEVEQLSISEVHSKGQVEERDKIEEVEETMSVSVPAEVQAHH